MQEPSAESALHCRCRCRDEVKVQSAGADHEQSCQVELVHAGELEGGEAGAGLGEGGGRRSYIEGSRWAVRPLDHPQ